VTTSKPRYDPPDTAQQETETIEIYGEDPQDLENKLPCRILSNFLIYDALHGNQLVSLDKIGESKRDVRAAGIVRPMFGESKDDDDQQEVEEEDEEEGKDEVEKQENILEQFIELSAIFYWETQLQTSGRR
jgi:hypothetical protein